jgi:protease YdgD
VPLRLLPIQSSNRNPAIKQTVMRAGYSQDQINRLTVDPSCHIVYRDPSDRFLFTDCDTIKGDSGSPLLLQDASGYQVIGVVSGIFQSNRGRAGTVAVSANSILSALAKLKTLGISPPQPEPTR